jgi:hypothetical protein
MVHKSKINRTYSLMQVFALICHLLWGPGVHQTRTGEMSPVICPVLVWCWVTAQAGVTEHWFLASGKLTQRISYLIWRYLWEISGIGQGYNHVLTMYSLILLDFFRDIL